MNNDETIIYTLGDVTGEPAGYPMASTPVQPEATQARSSVVLATLRWRHLSSRFAATTVQRCDDVFRSASLNFSHCKISKSWSVLKKLINTC